MQWDDCKEELSCESAAGEMKAGSGWQSCWVYEIQMQLSWHTKHKQPSQTQMFLMNRKGAPTYLQLRLSNFSSFILLGSGCT